MGNSVILLVLLPDNCKEPKMTRSKCHKLLILLLCLAVVALYGFYRSATTVTTGQYCDCSKANVTNVALRMSTASPTSEVFKTTPNIQNTIDKFEGVDLVTMVDGQWHRMDLQTNKSSYWKTALKSPAGDGVIYIYNPKDDKYVSGDLQRNGIWEFNLVDLLTKLVQEQINSTFVDLGANLGVFTLTMAMLGVPVIAIDCQHSSVERLVSSIEDNHLENYVKVIYNALLSRTGQELKMISDAHNKGGSRVVGMSRKTKLMRTIKQDVVYSIRLDDILWTIPGGPVIMKIDVESVEADVLDGAELFFTTLDVRYVLMEWMFHKGKQSGLRIIDFMQRHNMSAWDPERETRTALRKEYNAFWPKDIIWVKNLNGAL